uniref:Uncharacterized protein n=1 Tax=Octopus bimaculoides TaxID=37653 RepID=A0A0L8G478_OCTBM
MPNIINFNRDRHYVYVIIKKKKRRVLCLHILREPCRSYFCKTISRNRFEYFSEEYLSITLPISLATASVCDQIFLSVPPKEIPKLHLHVITIKIYK